MFLDRFQPRKTVGNGKGETIMPLTKNQTYEMVATAWLLITVSVAVATTGMFGDSMLLFGLPWIIYLAIICQLSIFGLFIFISKTLWKVEEEAGQ
jgi:hypothetical protein